MVQTAPDEGASASPRSASPRVLQKKREILRAAAALFRRNGLRATGMREIAAACGMAVGNLYYYFADKQDLLAFCQEDAVSGLLELADEVTALGLPPEEQLRRLIVGHALRLHEETPGAIAHLDLEALDEEARRAVVAQRDRYEATYRQAVRAGIADGSLRAVDPKLAAAAILGALNWTAQWYHPDGDKTPRQLGEELADLLLAGLLSATSASPAPGA